MNKIPIVLVKDFPHKSSARGEVERLHLEINQVDSRRGVTFADLAQHYAEHELTDRTEALHLKAHTTISGYERVIRNRPVSALTVCWLRREKSNRVRSTAELMLLADLDGYELRDAPGIAQRVGNVFGRQLAHGQCPVAFEGRVNGASVDPFDVFRRTGTTNHFHQKFCVFHNPLSCLEGSAEKESLHR